MKKIFLIALGVVLIACALFLASYIWKPNHNLNGDDNLVPSGDSNTFVFDEPEESFIMLEGIDEPITTQRVHSNLGYTLDFDLNLFSVKRENGMDIYYLLDSPYDISAVVEKDSGNVLPNTYDSFRYVEGDVSFNASIIVDPSIDPDILLEMHEGLFTRIRVMFDSIHIVEPLI